MTALDIQRNLANLASSKKAKILMRFFKTGVGQYAEGDKFRGIMVPVLRKTALEYLELSLTETIKLLKSHYNEDRCTALFILTYQFQKGDLRTQATIAKAYLANTRYINNWNLVDLSAYKILGNFLFEKDCKILYRISKSKVMWERRIAVVSTFYFIQRKDFNDILKISKLLLKDTEDLMHKCVGWMLREVGKRDKSVLIQFLKTHKDEMPRTMLRYAIEKFPKSERQKFLKKG